MMARTLTLLTLLMTSLSLNAAQPDWSTYNQLLKRHVGAQVVNDIQLNYIDYRSLFKDPEFSALIETIENFPIQLLMTRQEKLVFYINTYNIFAMKVVRDNSPLKSIKDAGSWFSPVWNKAAGKLNGQRISLGEIEHKILRPLSEPRIHFAIVCASLSCPDLRREAFTIDNLDRQLDDQVLAFLNNPKKGLSMQGNTAVISQIFDWFEDDFKPLGGVGAFIQTYLPNTSFKDIEADLPYDWSLNGS
jgi:hypothetical protein